MPWFRLGDYLEDAEKGIEDWNTTADSLSQRVFGANPLNDKWETLYINSNPAADLQTSSIYKTLTGKPGIIGQYEAVFIGKILNPPNPAFCIVGPMGSGKTTTAKYVIFNLIVNRINSATFPKPLPPLIAHINFLDHENLSSEGRNKKELLDQIYGIITSELQARLNHFVYLSKEEEFGDFWDFEFEEYNRHRSTSIVFSNISSKLSTALLSRDEHARKDQILKRSSFFQVNELDQNLYLDYLIRKYRFIMRTKFNGFHGDVVVLLDNLDGIEPLVQSFILDTVEAHVRADGPTFVLLMRSETFYHHGSGTGLIDAEAHVGPNPSTVFENRLDLFLRNPESYYDARDNLDRAKFDYYVTYLKEVKNQCIDHGKSVSKYLSLLAGQSIRTGLLLAQRIFRVSDERLVQGDPSCFDIFRTMITGSPFQIRWAPTDPVSHLFRLSEKKYGGLLIKPRILAYLMGHQKERRRISEIIRMLKAFGYEEEAIVNAIIDLSSIYCQLISPTGYNYIKDTEYLRDRPSDKVMITDLGKNYYSNLISDYDYLGEIALDTWVERSSAPRNLGKHYVSQKLALLHTFLSEIRESDETEIIRFISSFGTEKYKEIFGNTILSQRIIEKTLPRVRKVIQSQLKTKTTREGEISMVFEGLQDDFNSLQILSNNMAL